MSFFLTHAFLMCQDKIKKASSKQRRRAQNKTFADVKRTATRIQINNSHNHENLNSLRHILHLRQH